jgi:hypothetical protein
MSSEINVLIFFVKNGYNKECKKDKKKRTPLGSDKNLTAYA